MLFGVSLGHVCMMHGKKYVSIFVTRSAAINTPINFTRTDQEAESSRMSVSQGHVYACPLVAKF